MTPQDQAQTALEYTEQTLRQALSRLSLALETSDQVLTRQLNSLRNALKNGANGEQIQALMDEISASIIRIDQHRITQNAVASARKRFDASLKNTPPPKELHQSTERFRQALETASRDIDANVALHAHSRYLQTLLAWMGAGDAGDALQKPAKPHLLKRLFGWGADHPGASPALHTPGLQEVAPPFNQVLFDLLHRLDLPVELSEQTQDISQRLHQPPTASLASTAVNEIADLMAKSRLKVEQEKSEIEGFLAQLTTHLLELERHLEDSLGNRGRVSAQGSAIHASMSAEVAEIRRSVDEAQDIQLLKTRIQIHLEKIQKHMVAREKLEESQLAQAQAELEKLRVRLAHVEEESGELRARLREARELALRDALTGLHNRLAYDQRIVQECERWHRYGHPAVLSIWDIDHFKHINDRFSHTAGDNALKALAKLMQESTRKSDFLARFGGEEFMLLLPETTIETALQLANRLRERVAAKRFQYRGQSVPLSISCGLTAFLADDTPEEIYRRADAALYRAKANGRNRCVVFSDKPCMD